MKISLIFAAIIFGLAALFTSKQEERIKTLTTEWEDLKITALEKNIPTDPAIAFSSQRVHSENTRAAREKADSDFATELVAFAKRIEAAEENGTANDPGMQKEIIGVTDRLTTMSPNELEALIKALSAEPSIKDKTKHQLIQMSLMMVSSGNPEAALAMINESDESLSLGRSMRQTLPGIIIELAAKDPAAAADWVVENEEQFGNNATEMKRQVITAAAKKSLTSAMAIANTLDPGDSIQVHLLLGNEVTSKNQDDFIKILNAEKTTKNQRRTAFANLVNSPLIKEDFKAATAWLESPAFTTTDKESFIQSLHFYGVRENPPEWLSWIATQDVKDEASTRATHRIIKSWTRDNFVATGEWIQTLEAGPAKNTAIQTYAKTLAPQEPAAAADWATTLPDGTDRTKLLQTIHTSLKEKDPAAAAALAEKHQLKID